MGTSTGYQMPTGGEWTPLKNDATRFVKNEPDGNVTPQDLMRRYIQAQGGLSGLSGGGGGEPSGSSGGGPGSGGGSGGGGGGGGGRGGGSRAAQRVGSGLGNFLSGVGSVGLRQALDDIGLGDLAGKSAAEIGAALLDKLAGPANTLDDAAARTACDELNQELLKEARTPEEVEQALKGALDLKGLGGLLMRFFSLYLYQRFIRDFYETWSKRVGIAQAGAKLKAIKGYIDETFKDKVVNKDITAMNWNRGAGGELLRQILGDTCQVFGVNP